MPTSGGTRRRGKERESEAFDQRRLSVVGPGRASHPDLWALLGEQDHFERLDALELLQGGAWAATEVNRYSICTEGLPAVSAVTSTVCKVQVQSRLWLPSLPGVPGQVLADNDPVDAVFRQDGRELDMNALTREHDR